MAYFIIGEVASARDIISISTSLIAVFLIMAPQVTAGTKDFKSSDVVSDNFSYNVALFGLFFCPFLTAVSRIQIKQMKSVKPFVLAAYLNFSMLIISTFGIIIAS
jgi:hypothetical protein